MSSTGVSILGVYQSDFGRNLRKENLDTADLVSEVVEGTLAHELYDEVAISERHRHRFEYNNDYRERLQAAGLVASGVHPELDLVEIVELANHPFFIGVQFHPEFKSRPLQPHPIFRGFVKAAREHHSESESDLLPQEVGA